MHVHMRICTYMHMQVDASLEDVPPEVLRQLYRPPFLTKGADDRDDEALGAAFLFEDVHASRRAPRISATPRPTALSRVKSSLKLVGARLSTRILDQDGVNAMQRRCSSAISFGRARSASTANGRASVSSCITEGTEPVSAPDNGGGCSHGGGCSQEKNHTSRSDAESGSHAESCSHGGGCSHGGSRVSSSGAALLGTGMRSDGAPSTDLEM